MARVAAIVLAAGASSRMAALGRPKALLPVAAMQHPADPLPPTFAEAIARTAFEGGVTDVIFVLGPPHGDEIRAHLPPRCTSAWNPDPTRGMLSSIQSPLLPGEGVQSQLADSRGEGGGIIEALLIWPVDQPLIAADTVRAILSAPADRIVIPTYENRGGHPVRIPRDLFPALLALPHERGLRGLMQDHRARILRLPVDDAGVVRDVDTPEDYRDLGRDPSRPRDR